MKKAEITHVFGKKCRKLKRMNEKRWFILRNEQVLGPLSAKDLLRDLEGKNNETIRLWAKGKANWQPFSELVDELKNESTNNVLVLKTDDRWWLKENGIEAGPMPFEQLIHHLKKTTNLEKIKVANYAKRQWDDVFAIPAILEKLGINRRAVPRVPIEGTATISEGPLKGQHGLLASISQGGFGIKNIEGLSIGESIKGTLNCPALGNSVHFQAEVVFINKNSVGAKFLNLSTEGLSQIIFYVNQFISKHPDIDFRKIG
ncbi:MAG: hypothetical protein RJB66_917 [Pseudomonadota bacterium]